MPGQIVVVVLAAGAGLRFRDNRHKLLAELPALLDAPAETVAARSIRRSVDAAIGPVVLVTGAVDIDVPDGVTECPNPDWAEGQASSLQAGLRAARDLDAVAAVVGLADQPAVTAEAWRAVAGSPAPIAVATYDGVRGNPVRLAPEVWDLLPTEGDEGARSLMRLRPDLVGEVPCTGSATDIDTVEDLRRWQKS
jgi:CTP:molybdopterin cytidylyltransferase MocA